MQMKNIILIGGILLIWISTVIYFITSGGYASIYFGYHLIGSIVLLLFWLSYSTKKALRKNRFYQIFGWSLLISNLINYFGTILFFKGGIFF
ncbi:hypothetical protein DCC35_00550 [Mangrovivirga cuniculi]|uniref:Uncharacterized protein n=1 Tax=Mangrovivirga cuniculi TaxID=2715131 RepID=A0A4D7JDM7_9BACT|nr:hypothetical protein DCC35_00550 [Mangrovivirga cuniculi]